jgi:hypothetical protein
VPVSLASAGLAPARPASLSTGAGRFFDQAPTCILAGDTQPVKTQPVRVAPVPPSLPLNGELGRLVYAYRPVPQNKMFTWVWGFGGAVLSLAPLSYGGYVAFINYDKFGPVAALSRSMPLFVLGGSMLLIWLAIGMLGRARIQPGIRLHANGLFIEGRRKQSLTWDEIDGIAQGVTAPVRMNSGDVHYQVTVFPNKGRPVHLYGSGDGKRGIPYLPELVSRIKASLYPTLQLELARMFRAGLPLRFGPVRIDRQGLKLRRQNPFPGMLSVPWGHVKHITVQSGYFLVESSDRRKLYQLPVSKIPNLEILLKIIDQDVQQ